MESMNLGPNGGLIYCMEYLLAHFQWLEDKISALVEDDRNDTIAHYIIFDCPGQVELYTHYNCVMELIQKLSQRFDTRLCCVHLVDSFYCCQPAVFISAVLLTTTIMLKLALPHISVLSKVDLLSSYGPLPFNLDFFTELMDLSPILRYLEGSVPQNDDKEDDDNEEEKGQNRTESLSLFHVKYKKLTEALCEVVNDFGLVSFMPLNIQDKQTMSNVLKAIDDANGFSFAALAMNRTLAQSSNQNLSKTSDLFRIAVRSMESPYSRSLEIQERYCNDH